MCSTPSLMPDLDSASDFFQNINVPSKSEHNTANVQWFNQLWAYVRQLNSFEVVRFISQNWKKIKL
jgi:hypothetical protein